MAQELLAVLHFKDPGVRELLIYGSNTVFSETAVNMFRYGRSAAQADLIRARWHHGDCINNDVMILFQHTPSGRAQSSLPYLPLTILLEIASPSPWTTVFQYYETCTRQNECQPIQVWDYLLLIHVPIHGLPGHVVARYARLILDRKWLSNEPVPLQYLVMLLTRTSNILVLAKEPTPAGRNNIATNDKRPECLI